MIKTAVFDISLLTTVALRHTMITSRFVDSTGLT
jgi:hypothetical protein